MARPTFAIIVVLFAVINSPRLAHIFKHNLFAIHLLQSHTEVLSNAPWASHSWWNTFCRYENGSLEPDLLKTFNTKADLTYLQAIFTTVQGDCYGAAEILKTIRSHQPNTYLEQALLAYVYSMSGEWIESATVVPVNDIPIGNWPLRRYWGNVLLRAGIAGEQPALIQESESLLNLYRPDSDMALYEFWVSRGNLVAAFEELRWVISELDESNSHKLLEDYELLARHYIAAQLAVNPDSEKWSHLPAHYNEVNTFEEEGDKEPAIVLDHQLDEQWVLWGFTVDETELAFSPFISVTLYWRYSEITGIETLITENKVVHNRVPDAGFEWYMPVDSVRPFGYSALYRGRHPYPYTITHKDDKQVLCLLNGDEVRSTGVQTRWMPVPISSQRLIVSGQYQTEHNGAATFGLRWRGDDGEIKNSHVVGSGNSDEWQTVSQVLSIPNEAREIAFHLLQYRSQGTVCFDNLLMFTTDLPLEKLQ